MPTDKRLMKDLWIASKPETNEHRISFTLNLTTVESDRLKAQGTNYLTEALRTVRNLLSPFQPKDIVVVVQQNGSVCGPNMVPDDLHLHGWIRVKKTVTKNTIHTALKQSDPSKPKRTAKSMKAAKYKRTSKIVAKNGICFKDSFRPKWNITGPRGPITVGWMNYIVRQFHKIPIGCEPTAHMFAASKGVKSRATAIRAARTQKFNGMRRMFTREDRLIKQNKGEWKYWSDAYDDYAPDILDQNDPQYHS